MESVYLQKANEDLLTKIEFVGTNILGFKVKLSKSDRMNDLEGKGRYGIKSIKLSNDNKGVRLKECKESDDLETNMFYTDEWEFSDTKAKKSLLKEKKTLALHSNQLQA